MNAARVMVASLLASSSLLVSAMTLGVDPGPSVLVYPSGPTVPENLLRVELRFPAPLRHPVTIDEVKLVDDQGREIDGPFLDLPLPASDGRRVTILLHPGRVKSGLLAHSRLGRALRAGSAVTLVVEHPEIRRAIRKTWTVTAADDALPQPAQWTFEVPRAGACAPIVLQLDAPISSSAETLIAIRGPDGRRVAGTTCLESAETIWRFAPSQPWGDGSYAVVVHPDLEDPAGNRPSVPFEAIDGSRVPFAQETALPFEPRPVQ